MSELRPRSSMLLDLCTLCWVTGTIGASMRLYFNTRVSGRVPLAAGPIEVPTFARDLTRPPPAWVERARSADRPAPPLIR
jgi:hypothetical protein